MDISPIKMSLSVQEGNSIGVAGGRGVDFQFAGAISDSSLSPTMRLLEVGGGAVLHGESRAGVY